MVRGPHRDRVPLRDRSERVEELGQSRTFADSAAARSAQAAAASSPSAASCANSREYSFMADPQPAALTTIVSTPAASNVSMVCRANRARLGRAPGVRRQRAAAVLRARDDHIAPLGRQHPRGGRVDAGKNTDCTHPVSMPTTARRGPRAVTRAAAARAAAGLPGRREPQRLVGGG